MPKTDPKVIADPANKSSKKRRNLMKYYNALDKQSKKDINERFIRKVKEQKPSAFQSNNFNLQNVISQHVSKSKTRKAIKSIFPPSMYDKANETESSNSRSRSKKRAEILAKPHQKIHNVIKKNKLPPLPEISAAKAKNNRLAKDSKVTQMEMRRASAGTVHQKGASMSHKRINRSGTRHNEEIDSQVLAGHKYPYSTQYQRNIKTGGRKRNLSEGRHKEIKKIKSLTRDNLSSSNSRSRKNKNTGNVSSKGRKKSSKSKSKSHSKRRNKNVSRDGGFSTSAASNAGRMISSASTSDKRSMRNQNIKHPFVKDNKLAKIEEKTKEVKSTKAIPKEKQGVPPAKASVKTAHNTAVKPRKNPSIKSQRTDISKEKQSNFSHLGTSHKNDSSEKDQSMDLKKFGNIFAESGEKKIQKSSSRKNIAKMDDSESKDDKSNQHTSDEKTKISKDVSRFAKTDDDSKGKFWFTQECWS